ncbi:MAG: hypothetical protein AAF739_10240 [Pseudomonadota bacterium]
MTQAPDTAAKPGLKNSGNEIPEEAGLTAKLANSRWGLSALSAVESTVLPIPMEAVAIPLMIGHPVRALRIALFMWLGCLVGAVAFYVLGYTVADTLVRPALDELGLLADFEAVTSDLSDAGLFWKVFIVSVTPVPLQLATLGAGAVQGSFVTFLAAVAASRALRYFGLAVATQFIGRRLDRLAIPKRYLMAATLGVLLAGWLLTQLLGG